MQCANDVMHCHSENENVTEKERQIKDADSQFAPSFVAESETYDVQRRLDE